MTMALTDIEVRLLVQAIFLRYGHDFRDYAPASLRRRVLQAQQRMGLGSISALQERVLHDPDQFAQLLQYLTVPVSEMFRDPAYFLALRRHVVPVLRTYPSLKIWVAGCSTGEEVYSLAILLKEEQLLDRTTIYPTDINPDSLAKARAGVYELSRVRQFTENHRLAGGTGSLSDYYSAAHGAARLHPSLRERVVFSDHSLATDSVFAEVQLVTCRNVLIYFNRTLQERVIALFKDALCHRGFLGLGSRESLRFTAQAGAFEELVRTARIYQKVAE